MRILITGAGSVMGQSIFRALAMNDLGTPIEIAFANSDPLGAGQYFNDPSLPIFDRPVFPLAADPSYVDVLAKYVADNNIDIVFAGTQHELQKVAEYASKFGPAATLTPDLVQLCMDKAALAAALESHGVPVARTWAAEDFPADGVTENLRYIVKPSFSSASRNIKFCTSATQVREHIASIDDVSQLVVQETLTGPEYTTGCYVDRYSQELSTITFQRELSPDGASVYGEVIVDQVIVDYMDAIYRGLSKEGFEYGHFNVQFIMTTEGPRLFEINGRLSSTEAPKAHFGFNSCAAYVQNKVLSLPYPGLSQPRTGKFLRYYDEVYFDEHTSAN